MEYKDKVFITSLPFRVLKPWIDNIRSQEYKQYKKFHTGLDIQADKVYNYAPGAVIQIGYTGVHYVVTVQYSAEISLRYDHLKKVDVEEGQILHPGMLIGLADRYVHFEYISTNQENSKWPVRIGPITYFKHNPQLVFDGTVVINYEDWKVVTQNIGYFDPVEYMRRYY